MKTSAAEVLVTKGAATETLASGNITRKESVKHLRLADNTPTDYPDEQNPFASDFEEKKPEETRKPISKILPPKLDIVKLPEPVVTKAEINVKKEVEESAKSTEYVTVYTKEQETKDELSPAEAADLNRATKAIVTYYDDGNNLINQYNLVKNDQTDKLDNFLNTTALETNNIIDQTNNTSDIQFIDDENSFELVDPETASNLEALCRTNETEIKESLNYLAETYYKNDFERFFSDPAAAYDAEVASFQFRHTAETRGSCKSTLTNHTNSTGKQRKLK